MSERRCATVAAFWLGLGTGAALVFWLWVAVEAGVMRGLDRRLQAWVWGDT